MPIREGGIVQFFIGAPETLYRRVFPRAGKEQWDSLILTYSASVCKTVKCYPPVAMTSVPNPAIIALICSSGVSTPPCDCNSRMWITYMISGRSSAVAAARSALLGPLMR